MELNPTSIILTLAKNDSLGSIPTFDIMRRYVFEKMVKYQLVVDVADTSNDSYDTLMADVENTPIDEWNIINDGDEELKSINSLNKGYADFDVFKTLTCESCGRLLCRHAKVRQTEVLYSKGLMEIKIEYICNCGHVGNDIISIKE